MIFWIVNAFYAALFLVMALVAITFLAGGLNERNVAEAIGTVGPFGVDVCSGVRTEGRLDENKLRAFMAAVIGASPSP